MKKQILNLGQKLTTKEKKEIIGGTSGTIQPPNLGLIDCGTTYGSPCESDSDCCHNPAAQCVTIQTAVLTKIGGEYIRLPQTSRGCNMA